MYFYRYTNLVGLKLLSAHMVKTLSSHYHLCQSGVTLALFCGM